MDKNLYFDHSYTQDKNHRFLMRLERLGFTISSETMEHPGGAVCRFILFNAKNPRKRNYLEFVHTKPGHKAKTIAGFSFGYANGLEKFHKKIKKKIPSKYIHRNYNWKEDSRNRHPGWNFLTFKNPGIKSFYPWITEYERPKGWSPKKRKTPRPHANKIDSIVGFEFEINSSGAKFFKNMCGRKNESVLKFGQGVKFYFNEGRSTKIKNVILHSPNLKNFIKKYKVDGEITFQGRPAALIKNPDPKMWNIIII